MKLQDVVILSWDEIAAYARHHPVVPFAPRKPDLDEEVALRPDPPRLLLLLVAMWAEDLNRHPFDQLITFGLLHVQPASLTKADRLQPA
jgi:hypothetical protein